MNNQYLFNEMYYDFIYSNDYKEYCEKSAKKDKESKEEADKAKERLSNLIAENNNILRNYSLLEGDVSIVMPQGVCGFMLQTVYPGLLIGTGYPHSSGVTSEEIKLGFTLDYTTGLPYIPGSTVKGVLRSVFKKEAPKGKKESDSHYALRCEAYKNRIEYLRETITFLTGNSVEDVLISELEKEIFEGTSDNKGDIFFDAYPIRGGAKGKIFDFDSITPHDGVKNPVPLKLLKVLPEVVFKFNFCISDSKVIHELTASKKEQLYKTIIMDFGVGAKTNVGFGMLEEVDLEMLDKKIGVIKDLDKGKKFGFISYTGGKQNIFFHNSECKGVRFEELAVGDKVSFTVGIGKNGKSAAKSVCKLEK